MKKHKQVIPFDHAKSMLDVLDETKCEITSFDYDDISSTETLQKRIRNLQESISDWDLIIEMQLHDNLDEYGLECLKSDRKSRQQVITELNIAKRKLKEMMKNNKKELIAV